MVRSLGRTALCDNSSVRQSNIARGHSVIVRDSNDRGSSWTKSIHRSGL
jgi:hypothetical protein